jgi:hypothetical protein
VVVFDVVFGALLEFDGGESSDDLVHASADNYKQRFFVVEVGVVAFDVLVVDVAAID